MPIRGLRGAAVAEANTREAILAATAELLAAMVDSNGLDLADVASVFFTATPDLDAAFPALAARQLGWRDTALMCAQEIAVPGSLARCIRVLIHWNTEKRPEELRHIYIGAAAQLRPDRDPHPAPSPHPRAPEPENAREIRPAMGGGN
jgi:chorismate mutase